MKRIVLILVVLFSFTVFNWAENVGDGNKLNSSELAEKFISIVKSILEGEEYSKFKDNISSEAYVINGNKYESIFEILNNPAKKEMFIEEKGVKVEFIQILLSDDQREAYMVLETKSSDNAKISWHSILLKTNQNQKWQILSWHKS